MQRHRLVGVRKVTVIPVGTRRHPRGDRGVELRRVEAPLFAGVATEELLVELTPNLADHHVFGGADLVARLGNRSEKLIEFEGGQLEPVDLIDRIEVDRDRHELPIDRRPDAVLIGTPLGEPRKVHEDIARVGMKDMGPVLMYEDAVVIVVVVGVAANMRTHITDEDLLVRTCQPLGQHTSCKTCSNYQKIKLIHTLAPCSRAWQIPGTC